jgi:hypothetical protein
MAQSEKRGSWRGHVGWLAGQLIVVFAGVSAAFVVENYRDSKNQQAEFRQALSGVFAELSRYEDTGTAVRGWYRRQDFHMGTGRPQRDASYPGLLSDSRCNASPIGRVDYDGVVRVGPFDRARPTN